MDNFFLFRAKTQEGSVIKNLFELLQQSMCTVPIEIDHKGMSMCAIDSHDRIMMRFNLDMENFLIYECQKSIILGVSCNHMYSMLKSIKKKDTITMFILSSSPDILSIKIESKDNNNTRSNISNIKIQYTHKLEIELPTGYPNPIVISSNDYQKLCKEMNNISKIIEVISKGKDIYFVCDAGGIFSKEVSFGENKNEYIGYNHKNYKDIKDVKVSHNDFIVHMFNTSTITNLIKMTGLSQNIQIYITQDLPLFFKMRVGSLGNISIYIKSNEQIKKEEEDEDM